MATLRGRPGRAGRPRSSSSAEDVEVVSASPLVVVIRRILFSEATWYWVWRGRDEEMRGANAVEVATVAAATKEARENLMVTIISVLELSKRQRTKHHKPVSNKKNNRDGGGC